MYVRKSQRNKNPSFKPSPAAAEKYLRYLEKFEALEKELANLPTIDLLGSSYFPHALTFAICIQKELLKWAYSALKSGDMKTLYWLCDNAHINEEIRLLQNELKDLKYDLDLAKKRGEL